MQHNNDFIELTDTQLKNTQGAGIMDMLGGLGGGGESKSDSGGGGGGMGGLMKLLPLITKFL